MKTSKDCDHKNVSQDRVNEGKHWVIILTCNDCGKVIDRITVSKE